MDIQSMMETFAEAWVAANTQTPLTEAAADTASGHGTHGNQQQHQLPGGGHLDTQLGRTSIPVRCIIERSDCSTSTDPNIKLEQQTPSDQQTLKLASSQVSQQQQRGRTIRRSSLDLVGSSSPTHSTSSPVSTDTRPPQTISPPPSTQHQQQRLSSPTTSSCGDRGVSPSTSSVPSPSSRPETPTSGSVGRIESDSFAIIPSTVLMVDLVRTALLRLGYSSTDAIGAKGFIQLKNWKPLTIDQIMESTDATVNDMLGDVSSSVTLRIRLFRKSISAQEVKEKLIQILMAHSRTFAMNNQSPNNNNNGGGNNNCHPALDQVPDMKRSRKVRLPKSGGRSPPPPLHVSSSHHGHGHHSMKKMMMMNTDETPLDAYHHRVSNQTNHSNHPSINSNNNNSRPSSAYVLPNAVQQQQQLPERINIYGVDFETNASTLASLPSNNGHSGHHHSHHLDGHGHQIMSDFSPTNGTSSTNAASSVSASMSASSLADDRRMRRTRTFIDPTSEIPRLEQWFLMTSHPSRSQIERFTEELNKLEYRRKFPRLEAKNLQFWFKNRRAKQKRLTTTGSALPAGSGHLLMNGMMSSSTGPLSSSSSSGHGHNGHSPPPMQTSSVSPTALASHHSSHHLLHHHSTQHLLATNPSSVSTLLHHHLSNNNNGVGGSVVDLSVSSSSSLASHHLNNHHQHNTSSASSKRRRTLTTSRTPSPASDDNIEDAEEEDDDESRSASPGSVSPHKFNNNNNNSSAPSSQFNNDKIPENINKTPNGVYSNNNNNHSK